ncbi:MAG TPA: PIG-L family deacetylase, partial [Opitutus sp.]|nr:PIG-L family deacetylase [Opitutus sp.]
MRRTSVFRASLSGLALLFCLPLCAAPAVATDPMPAHAILQELRNLRETGSVLYIAAHPDDENNRLLPYLARGRALRTAYLSLTRGDGGQNRICPELGELLGIIRTHELIAARRVDGAQQFFTRARDFGFSKDSADTLQRWNRQEVVADIVRVLRTFRPDIVINRFSTEPGGTHGHHTASAILGLEAFKLAGDPTAFPEQLATLEPWQPKRIFWNSWTPPGSNAPAPAASEAVLRIDAGGFDPLLGESFGEIGARGRSMHKSQGEGRTGTRGTAFENFTLLAGAHANNDLFDGIDTTWARFPGGADIGSLIERAIAAFQPLDPAASVPALLEIRRRIDALAPDPLLAEKRAQLDRVLQACLGLFVETVVPNALVTPGESLPLRHTAIVRTRVPIRWTGTRYPLLATQPAGEQSTLRFNEPASREATATLPIETALTHPYWLQEDGTEGMFAVGNAELIGRPENPPAFPIEHRFEIGGQTLVIADQPVQVITDPVRGEIRRPLAVIAPVSLRWTDDLALFPPGGRKSVTLELTAARAEASGTLQLDAPPGWQVSPATQPFALAAVGDRARHTFDIIAPPNAGRAKFMARAALGERRYHRDRIEIRYDHIPPQLLQPSAVLHTVSLDVAIRGASVGYLPGAGDLVAESLARMGYRVTLLSVGDLTLENLQRFDAVVLGVRAFNVHEALDARMPAVFAYAEQGGNVIVQYNTNSALRSSRLAPYPLQLS